MVSDLILLTEGFANDEIRHPDYVMFPRARLCPAVKRNHVHMDFGWSTAVYGSIDGMNTKRKVERSI